VRIVLLWLLLEVAAAAQVRQGGEPTLLRWLRAVGRPIAASGEWISSTVAQAAHGLRESGRLARQNRLLGEELERSRAEALLLHEDLLALREATQLPDSLLMASRHIAARCTFRDIDQGRMQITAGLAHGVRKGAAAVGAGGLVGRVSTSTYSASWLQLITHPAAAVAVRTRDGGVTGLVAGTGHQTLRVEYVARTARLLRDSLLLSSGADGVYPPGLAVARVTSVRETSDPFLEIRARPTASLATLRVVLVLDPEPIPAGDTP
jgi:rod shape-determining protein MreC